MSLRSRSMLLTTQGRARRLSSWKGWAFFEVCNDAPVGSALRVLNDLHQAIELSLAEHGQAQSHGFCTTSRESNSAPQHQSVADLALREVAHAIRHMSSRRGALVEQTVHEMSQHKIRQVRLALQLPTC